MIRKFLLGSVASLGLLSPLAFTPSADAHEFHHAHVCRVFYRDPCRPVWIYAGTFHGHRSAERFAERYRCRGFLVSIRY
jgi:hypothetical protein